MHIFCAFGPVRWPFHLSQVMWLCSCEPPKCPFPPSPPHDRYSMTAAAERIAIKTTQTLLPMFQYRQDSLIR